MVIQVLFLFLIRKKLDFPFFRKYVFWKGRKSPLADFYWVVLPLVISLIPFYTCSLRNDACFMYSRHFLSRLHKMFNRCTSYSLYSSYLIFLWALLPETCYITLHCEKMLPWYYVYLCLKTLFYDKTKRFKRIIVSYISTVKQLGQLYLTKVRQFTIFSLLYCTTRADPTSSTSSVSTPEAFP